MRSVQAPVLDFVDQVEPSTRNKPVLREVFDMKCTKLSRWSPLVLAVCAGTLHANPINTDFQVTDEDSYLQFREAVHASQYVRYDYAMDQNPRVVIAVAGLMAFATQNPDADSTQLSAFVNAFDSTLSGYAPGDPDLDRSTNLLPAMRYTTPLTGYPELEGTDTRVGEQITEILGLEVPEIESYDNLLTRVAAYERARVTSFANRDEWLSLLMAGFAGFDLDGITNAHISSSLRSYLESQGFEPVPDGVDDERFDTVQSSLDASLPADYASYTAMLTQSIENSSLWGSLNDSFADVALATQQRINELNTALSMEESIYQDMLDAQDPAEMQQLADAYRQQLEQVAQYRAIIDANAMMLLQSADPDVRDLAQQALSFGGTQLQTNETIAGINAGVQYASALTTFGFGIATGSPADAITGLADVVLSSIELGEVLGGSSVPSADEQIFGQLVEMRDQLEEVRVQMNQRFDRIEVQLNTIYDALAVGFNELGNSIFDLNVDVQALRTEIMGQQAQLERIEQQLWGMADDLFRDDLAELVDGIVAYRERRGVDLPYEDGATNFADEIIDLFTKATFTASVPTYAGNSGENLSLLDTSDLEQNPLGRSINDLRVFPTDSNYLNQPLPLYPSRVVAPGPWAQASSAYAQVAQESPWYFAYMYESQLDGGLMNPDLDLIIQEGEALRAMALEARQVSFFQTIVDQYTATMIAMDDIVDDEIAQILSDANLSSIDPWGGVNQQGRQDAPGFTTIYGRDGLGTTLPAATTLGDDIWDLYHFNTLPELTAALEASEDPSGGTPTVELRVYPNGFFEENDVEFRFSIIIDNPNGSDYTFNRSVICELTSFGSPIYIHTNHDAQELLEQDLPFWYNIALTFFNGENLVGTSLNTFNGNGDQVTLEFTQDNELFGSNSAATSYIENELNALQDEMWLALINNTGLDALESSRNSWESIWEAYTTLAMPEIFEQSTAVSSAMRGSVFNNEIALAMPIDDWFFAMIGDGDNGQYTSIRGDFETRALLIQDEINEAINTYPDLQGHSLIEWTLAELRHLRDQAFKLAVDDSYVAAGGSLEVDALEGLMHNDIDQAYRAIEVDTGFAASNDYIAPQNGTVEIQADGSFTYTPNHGFVGIDRFSYRTTTTVNDSGSRVYSDPAIVQINVLEGGCSAADLAQPYGELNFFDVSAFLMAYTNGDAAADLNEDGVFNFFDVSAFLAVYSSGCP